MFPGQAAWPSFAEARQTWTLGMSGPIVEKRGKQEDKIALFHSHGSGIDQIITYGSDGVCR